MTAARHEVVLSVGSGLPVPARDGLPTQGLDLGPAHPSSHGVIQLRVVVEGDRIVEAEPRIGFLHRGAEKLFEVRDYRQAMVLANRHDWLSAFGNELGIALAVERMLGMEVPERAVWLRTLLAELNRVLVHLAFLGSFPAASGVARPAYSLAAEREAVQEVLEEATGGRMHLMFNRVGGLREDVPGVVDCARARAAARRPRGPGPDRVVARVRRRGRGDARRRGAERRAGARRTACPARWPARPGSTSTCAATTPTSRTARWAAPSAS